MSQRVAEATQPEPEQDRVTPPNAIQIHTQPNDDEDHTEDAGQSSLNQKWPDD